MIDLPDESGLRARTGRKWQRHGPEVLPAWIADMDFRPAPAILATIEEAIRLGDFGYGPTAADSGVPQAFAAWARRRWDWPVDPDAVMLMPDVVGGLANCIEALTAPGDAVMVHIPAYPPLLSSVTVAGRRLVTSTLDGNGRFDLAAMDEAIVRDHVRLLLFCHPQNPTGHVFDHDELAALAALSRHHDLIVVSDEVHADLTYVGKRHIPFAMLLPEATVTLNAPSKAFNVAGLRTAVCIAPDTLKTRLAGLPSTRWNAFSTVGLRAAIAAWSDEGAAWLDACLTHLDTMRHALAAKLASNCPAIRYTPPEASYLAWLDCRALGLDDPAAFFLEHAKVALSPGREFGTPGTGFVRLNFATSEAMLDAIVTRMGDALSAAPHSRA